MPPRRRIIARLQDVASVLEDGDGRVDGEARCGVELGFVPVTGRLGVDRIDHYLPLGPDLSVSVALALARTVRLLRAARIAPPRDPQVLLGKPAEAAALLERGVGTDLRLELQPRSRVRFTIWTEQGVEAVEDVLEVVEDDSAWLVHRQAGRGVLRVPRDEVLRQRTDCQTWFEITGIERVG